MLRLLSFRKQKSNATSPAPTNNAPKINYAALGLEEIPVPVEEPNFEEKLTEQLMITEDTYLCPICGF